MARPQDFEAVSDYILSKIDIHVSGACGPQRSQPIDCFYPVHKAYSPRASKSKNAHIDHSMAAFIPGAVPRTIESTAAKDGLGIVYDRDIITTWRLPDTISAYQIFFWEKEFESSLGRNTMLVVLEAFYDCEPGIYECDAFEIMQRFRSFVEELGTQMVSITASSIVRDMMASFYRMKSGINSTRNGANTNIDMEPFAWEKPGLLRTLHEFVLTRECWKYAANQEPALEVSFGVTGGRRRSNICEEIVLHFHYSWNPPTVGFVDLQNVVTESTNFVLKPTVSSSRPFSSMPQLEIEYYIGPTHGSPKNWLQWDNSNACFQGIMPNGIAPRIGAQRLDSYTLPLELTTKITKQFPGEMKYETIMRCAMPLTVKRQADDCQDRYRAMKWVSSPLKTMLPPSILPRNVLDVQVRMVRDITLDSEIKLAPSDHRCRESRGASQSADSRPCTPRRKAKASYNVLKINRRGDLSSDSDGGSPDPTPRAVSIILSQKKNNASPRRQNESIRSVGSSTDLSGQRENYKVPQPFNEDNDKTPSQMSSRETFWADPDESRSRAFSRSHGCSKSGKILGERTHFAAPMNGEGARWPRPTRWWQRDGQAFQSLLGEDHEPATDVFEGWFHNTESNQRAAQEGDSQEESPTEGAAMSEAEVTAWQREIQRNYQESLAQKRNTETMQAEVWSDED